MRLAFQHHSWASQRVLEAWSELTPGGDLLDSRRLRRRRRHNEHLIGTDGWYLFGLGGAAATLTNIVLNGTWRKALLATP